MTEVEQEVAKKTKRSKPVDKSKERSVNKTESKEKQLEVKKSLLSDYQLTCLKRCLGWNITNIPKTINNFGEIKQVLYSYRNRYFTNPKPDLEDMVTKGIFEKGSFGENGIMHDGYRATEAGIQFLEEIANIQIIHVRKHDNVYEPVYMGTQDSRKVQR